jgi:thiol-disulfide isomerase/thioredoxin
MHGGKTSSRSQSMMGRLLPPIDITSEKQLDELNKRIANGPATLVLVYADWCGHCQRFKPTMEKLENMSGRSIQTARIRDDVFPKSSLSSSKIEGYPTLMLIDKDGKPTSFKNNNGEVSNAIPDHTDINKMSILVRNAGKPEGVALLKDSPLSKASNATVNTNTPTPFIPKNILADRLSESSVNKLNTNLINSSNSLINASTKSIKGGGNGGGLWSHLMIASKNVAPAAALFLGAESTRKRRGGSKKYKKSRKNRRI